MNTKEKLAKALTEANAPQEMIAAAISGRYDDFESHSATPIVDLVHDCQRANLPDLADRAMNGQFDSSAEEAESWFEREGKSLLKGL